MADAVALSPTRSLDKIEALRAAYDDPFSGCACKPEVLNDMEALFLGPDDIDLEERTTTYDEFNDLTLDNVTGEDTTYNPVTGASSEDDTLGEATLATAAVAGGCGLVPLRGILKNGGQGSTQNIRSRKEDLTIGPESTNSLLSEGVTEGRGSNGDGMKKVAKEVKGKEFDDMTKASTLNTEEDELILDACGWFML